MKLFNDTMFIILYAWSGDRIGEKTLLILRLRYTNIYIYIYICVCVCVCVCVLCIANKLFYPFLL